MFAIAAVLISQCVMAEELSILAGASVSSACLVDGYEADDLISRSFRTEVNCGKEEDSLEFIIKLP